MLGDVGGHWGELEGGEGTGVDLFKPQFRHRVLRAVGGVIGSWEGEKGPGNQRGSELDRFGIG